MPVAEYVLKRRAASRAPVVFQKTEEEKKEYVPPSILWTGTEEEWKQKTGQQDKAETIAENIKIKSALPTTTYNVPVDKGRINIQRQYTPIQSPTYTEEKRELTPSEQLRKSGEIDIQKASRARQEGKLGFFYEASGQTKQYFADTGESFAKTLKKPETALIVAGTLLLTRSPTASRYLTTAFELYSPIYATTEIKAIGEGRQTLGGTTGELGAYIGAFKVGKELPRYFGETNINLKAYPTEKKITFVGEGKLKGEKIKAVAVAEEGQSKLFLRKGKSLQITKSTDLLPSQSKIELIDRKLKVETVAGTTRGITNERFNIKYSGESGSTKINLDMTDIFKRRYTVTPEVFKVTKITPKGKEITQFDMTEPTIEYGKPEKTKDLIDIKKIREGIEVTQTRQPEISEVGFYKRVGVGELTIKEKSGFRRDFEPLLRSKKAGLLQETVLETRKPIVKIEPTAKPKGIQISTPKFKLTESFRTTLLPVNIQRQRQTTSTTNIKASIKATPTTRLEPMAQPAIKTQPITSVKPITQPIIKVSPISKTSPLSATSQIISPSPSPRYGDPPPPPPPFDPPPPLPFAFGGLYLPERQTRKKKYKGKFKRQINPTIKGIVFNTGELQSITGLYGVGGR